MKEANDLKISAAIRRELSSRRIDLSKIKFPVKAGEVTLEGDLIFVGLEKTNDEIAIELKFIESSLKNIVGVSSVNFELSNWKKNDSGIWEPVAGSSNSLLKHLEGEGLVCPECDFVIRFCPCCGKPLVAGAKPGMHKGGASKPATRKPALPPIKPIARKPRPIVSPIGSLSSSISKTPIANTIVTPKPVEKPVTDTNDSVVNTPTVKPEVESKPVVVPTPVPSVTNEVKPVEKTEIKPVEVPNATTVENNIPPKPVAVAKPVTETKPPVSATPLKPLKPLKPLGGLKPLNKTNIAAPKPVEAPQTTASVPSAAEPVKTAPEVAPQPVTSVETPVVTKPVAVPELASVPNLTPVEPNVGQTPNIENLNLSSNNSIPNQVPDSGLASGLNLNTPVPNFMKEELGDVSGLDTGLNQNQNSFNPQVPDLNFGLNPLASEIPQTPNMEQGLGLQGTDTGLDLGSLGIPPNPVSSQNPDLDLGLGFDLGANIPTSPIPNSLDDLGLNIPDNTGASPIPNLNISDLSQPVSGNDFNQPLGGGEQNLNFPNNDLSSNNMPNSSGNFADSLFGGLTGNDLNSGNQGSLDNSLLGGNPLGEDTPLPPMKSSQPQQQSANPFDSLGNIGEDDTPLPPMKSAQPAAPKKAPAKKKSNDIFASLFNDSSLGGGDQDGLGNIDGLDLNLEILSSGDESQGQAPSAAPSQSNNNPFAQSDSFLDLDNFLNTPTNNNSGKLGEKDSSGAFNLDDFDINNFKL